MIVTTIAAALALSAQIQQAKPIAFMGKPSISPIRTIADARAVALAAAPKGSIFAAALDSGVIRIYDAKSGKVVKELTDHPQPVYALAWSPDGRYFASGDESARIFVWDTTRWKIVRQYRQHQRGIQNLDFNNDGNIIVSTGKDDNIKIWDIGTIAKGAIRDIPGAGANFSGARFIGKTNQFGVGILGFGAREYTLDGQVLTLFTSKENVQDVDYSPDGKLMAAGSRESNVSIWTRGHVKRIGTCKGHEGWIWHVRFSPNGKLIASGADDRTVRIWDAKTFQPVQVIENQASFGSPIAWTADGKYLATVNVGEVLQINVVTPAQPAAPEKPTAVVKPVKKKARKKK